MTIQKSKQNHNRGGLQFPSQKEIKAMLTIEPAELLSCKLKAPSKKEIKNLLNIK